MRIQNIAGFAFIIICGFMVSADGTMSCTQGSECPFGLCDEGFCRCNIECSSYTFNQIFVCSNKTSIIQPICHQFAMACDIQNNIRVKILISQATNRSRPVVNCPSLTPADVEYEAEFCESQDYCSPNGICIVTGGEKRCVCNDNHYATDERCRVKTSVSVSKHSYRPPIESRDHAQRHNQFSNTIVQSHHQEPKSNNEFGPGSGMLGQIVPYAAVAIVSCMLFCCYRVIKHRIRYNKDPLKHSKEDEILELNHHKPVRDQEKLTSSISSLTL